ncbi:ATP-dependent Clp protease proteolytic subunit [Mastigocoleus sp. MO_188.B34]|uniref:SDH family Clp fold serine proteinase n=1 Tax=Mastigocoleus sp. MO_188.B34 TaxID=3036635 RepID=UPI002630D361|nr:ATP-dependent Clp protease proteolytic subunit [Mastigocoleus sp. MO_188.B34]MDJ0694566.1 ATP-dependent Clp protease proteolytic subunit [Mastigocoleus sp. MO_188.B34]
MSEPIDNIKQTLDEPLANLEESLIQYYEIPQLIRSSQNKLDEFQRQIQSLESQVNINDENHYEINELQEKIQEFIKKIEILKNTSTRDDFVTTQGYDIHVILMYTNKYHYGAYLCKDITWRVRELVGELLDKEVTQRKRDNVYIVLDTDGGDGLAAVQIYDILKKIFKHVNVIVADSAWSAGTIFSLCCNKILMLENALLGPIDSQIYLRDEELFQKSAHSYIDGVEHYLDLLMRKISNAPEKEAYLNALKKLISPINILDYGHCSNALNQVANIVAFRHRLHQDTPNDFYKVKNLIWNYFVSSGELFGHGYGLDAQFLREDVEAFKNYIYEVKYENVLYKPILGIHNIMYNYIFQKVLPTYLLAHRRVYKF